MTRPARAIAAPIHVLAARHLDPGMGRVELELPEGLTVAQIVTAALPQATARDIATCRVALVTDRGVQFVPRELWHLARPRPGVRVVLRLLAGKNALRSILSIVISIAALASGQLWGLQFGSFLGFSGAAASAVGAALIGVGVTVIGNLLINALIPPPKPESREAQNRYSISGWRNRVEPDGAVPDVLGEVRFAPPFGALSYSEIVGDWHYIRALFCLGYGPVEISDMRIGETSLSEFDDVEIELRYGQPGETPVSLYPRQIAEEAIGLELVRPLPRDELGEVIDDEPGEETPVVRTTGSDASGASVIVAFPSGLVRFDNGGKSKPETVSIRIEQRLVQAEDWLPVATLDITAKKLEAFYRQHTWQFPSRGRWQIRVTMMTDETTDTQVQRRVSWAALQTLRPEYPLNFDRPLALAAVRVKATHQLSGQLDSFNVLARRVCLDWDHVTETWIDRATSNPASLFRLVLQGPGNPKAVPDDGIDLEILQDWHDFCRIKGLHYDRVIEETGRTLRDVLTEIASAGRAAPRHDGLHWGVVIDRPDGLVVDHISERNSWDFSVTRSYVEPPHGMRVKFLDAANDYKPAERLVPWPGHVGPITLTEAMEMPYKTDAAEVYREALRRMLEAIHRPDIYQVTQDGPVRVATRGDKVRLSNGVISKVQMAARVRRVVGGRIELDELVQMEAGEDYAIRFRVGADEEDTIGVSVLRSVRTEPGATRILTLEGEGDLPAAGDLVLFGTASEDSYPLIVSGVEAAEGFASIMRLVDAAPQIDAIVDAAVVPEWSGRVGAEIDANLTPPPMPRFTSVTSTRIGAEAGQGIIDYLIVPGSGPIRSASYRIEHRLVGAPSWTSVAIPVANGGGRITGYAAEAAVELRAVAISATAVDGPVTASITLTVGAGDAAIPAAISSDDVTVTTTLGGASVRVSVGDARAAQIQIYRSTSSTLNRATDAVGAPVAVAAPQVVTVTVGETGKSSTITNGIFDSATGWFLGGGWSVAGGVASHATGTTGSLVQSQTLVSGKWYRLRYTVSGRSAGTVTPALQGGTKRFGTAQSANGTHLDRIQAVSGNTGIGFDASADLVASIDNVTFYQETAACLDQGTHYLWLEAQNADGVPGPVTGPFTITVT